MIYALFILFVLTVIGIIFILAIFEAAAVIDRALPPFDDPDDTDWIESLKGDE